MELYTSHPDTWGAAVLQVAMELNITSNTTEVYTITTDEDFLYYAELDRYVAKTKELLWKTSGVAVTTICIIGMLANMLNVIALVTIIRKSKLPVYRCFLGLAIADFMVSQIFCFLSHFITPIFKSHNDIASTLPCLIGKITMNSDLHFIDLIMA